MPKTTAKLFLLFAVSLTIASSTGISRAAGFDCAKADSGIEKMICAHPVLSQLDEQLNTTYQSALKANPASAGEIKKRQQHWMRAVRNQCIDPSCLLKVYRERIADLSTDYVSDWKRFKSTQLGIEFDYPAQRQIQASCHDSPNCVALIKSSMPVGTAYLLAFEVFDGNLNDVAVDHAVFEQTAQGWIAKGRSGEYPVQTLVGDGWRGIMAEVDCGISDDSGFHAAAGQCLWAVLSNGKRSVVIDTEGRVSNDALSRRSLQSFRFAPSP